MNFFDFSPTINLSRRIVFCLLSWAITDAFCQEAIVPTIDSFQEVGIESRLDRVAKLEDSLASILDGVDVEERRIDEINQFAAAVMDEDHLFSMSHSDKTLEESKRINYEQGAYEANVNLAQVHVNYTLNYERGITHLSAAHTYALKVKNLDGQLNCLRLKGFIYNELKEYPTAQLYYEAAIDIAQKLDRKRDVAELTCYLAYLLEAAGDHEGALGYLKKVAEQEAQTGFLTTPAETKSSIAWYYFLIGDLEKSLSLNFSALTEFEQKGNNRWAAYLMGEIGKVYLEKADIDSAIYFGKKGLLLAEQYQTAKEMSDNHLVLSLIYETSGDFKQALYHTKRNSLLVDSIFSMEKAKEIASIQDSYEEIIKEEEISQFKIRERFYEERISLIIWGSAILIFLVGVLTLLIYRAYAQKRNINQQLQDRVELKDLALTGIVEQLQKEILQHEKTQNALGVSHAELNHFFYRSSHDLKGPLSTIQGLCMVASLESKEPEQQEYLQMINSKSIELSTKLDRLVQLSFLSENFLKMELISLKLATQTIIEKLQERFDFDGISVDVSIKTEEYVRTDRTVLDLILWNLLDNAVRYQADDGSQHKVVIEYRKVATGLELSISDNGCGINAGDQAHIFDIFVKSNINRNGYGLGLYIVKKAVEKLGGTVSVRSEKAKGSEFLILIPYDWSGV